MSLETPTILRLSTSRMEMKKDVERYTAEKLFDLLNQIIAMGEKNQLQFTQMLLVNIDKILDTLQIVLNRDGLSQSMLVLGLTTKDVIKSYRDTALLLYLAQRGENLDKLLIQFSDSK